MSIQESTVTAYDRYPAIFAATSKIYHFLSKRPPRVLSFGCSIGDETTCLADKYFPDSQIIGLDVSESALDSARQRLGTRHITYATSTPDNLAFNGPYDIIFAMSVLCKWPESQNL